MRKEDKSAIIAQLGELIQKYPHFYLIDVEGMDATATSNLRRACFKSNLKMVLVKNTLLEKTLEASDVDFEALKPVLKGTTAVDCTIKKAVLIWSITFEKTYLKASSTISSYSFPRVSPYPWESIKITGLLL